MSKTQLFLFLFLIGVVFLVVRRVLANRRAWRRLRAVNLSGADAMSSAEFESYCVRLLENQSFHDIEMTRRSDDVGINLIAMRGGVRYGVQCKCQGANVSRQAISDVVGALADYKCNRAMVISNNFFSSRAVTEAESTGCELIDRDVLGSWIEKFQPKST